MREGWIKDKQIILYGCGMEGERFLARHPGLFDRIYFCIDRSRQGTFHGKPIKKIEEVIDSCSEYRIIITTLPSTYLRIREILLQYGLTEFSDFVYMVYLEKKMVLINANCHGGALAHYLTSSKCFNSAFQIYQLPEIQDNEEKSISPYVLENADVFIHQDIRKENRYSEMLSDDYLLSKLQYNCKKVAIPNFVGMGGFLFPQQGINARKAMTDHGEISLLYEDLILEEAVRMGMRTLKEFIDYYMEYEYSEAFLEELYRRDRKKIQRREENWDVKVWEFFEKHRKDMLFFIDKDHPSTSVMEYIGWKTLEILTGKSVAVNKEFEYEIGRPMPMVPSVKRHYQITPEEEDAAHYYGCTVSDLIPTYVKTYLWITHDIKL